jgi:DNA-binding CsgD family transcriptional regulator
MPNPSEAAILPVIDGIYAAACDFAAWPALLEQLADLLGARDAAFGTMSPTGIAWLEAPRTDPAFLGRYADYHAEDLVWHAIAASGVGSVVTDEMVGDAADLHTGAYYNEWSLPQGYRTKLGGLVLDEEGWQTMIVLPGLDRYSAEQVRLLKLLSPHLRRAMQIHMRLTESRLDDEVSTRVLDRLASGALLVDGNRRLLFANRAAEALFQPGGGLALSGGQLTATGRTEQAALDAAIARCARQAPADSGADLDLRCEGAPRQLRVIPLRRSVPLVSPGVPVALLIAAADRSDEAVTARLRLHYGLTPAEAAFAVEIAKGDGKRAAAARRGISYTTARTHLSRVFDKTGVRRQGELVRLILGRDPSDS